MDLDRQHDYYNRRWEEACLDELDSHQVARLEQIMRALDMIARDRPKPWRIVEVGCGTACLSGILLRYGRVTAIDLSEVGIHLSRKRFPQVEFFVRDISPSHYHRSMTSLSRPRSSNTSSIKAAF